MIIHTRNKYSILLIIPLILLILLPAVSFADDKADIVIFPRKSGHVVKLLYAAVQSLQGTNSSKSNASVDDYRIFLCIQKCFSWPHP